MKTRRPPQSRPPRALARHSRHLTSLFCALALACDMAAPVPRADEPPSPSPTTATPAPPQAPAAALPLSPADDPRCETPLLPWTAPPLAIRVGRVEKDETLAGALSRLGLSGGQVSEVIRALDGHFDFRRSRPGDQIRLTLRQGQLLAMEYRASMTREWLVTREGQKLVGKQRDIEVTTEVAQINATVDSSLYEALRAAGEDPSLAIDVADVFAWDIDFYRDLRRGDRLSLIVEKERVQGQLLRYGDILGARYVGDLVGEKSYLLYRLEGGGEGYFDSDGQSAKKAFLKSPLKYTFITSTYGSRQHPVLGYRKDHKGIDLRAAVGTPVWSVADGTVTRAVKGDRVAGTYLFVRHTNGIETTYLHLSRFADGIRVGSRVRQKQIIAYSGNTGRSTGPHLHYGMKRGGDYVNPLSQKFPRADPLPQSELARFHAQTQAVAQALGLIHPGATAINESTDATPGDE